MQTRLALALLLIGMPAMAVSAAQLPAAAVLAQDGSTALHWAVHQDDAALVQQLLKDGADANATTDYGATPLSEAAVSGNPLVLAALIKAGADVNAVNHAGQSALMVLARTSNVAAVRVLLKAGARINAAETVRGQTALMWAAAQGQPAMVRELIAHGADVNARTTVNEHQRQVSGEPRAQYRPAGGFTPLMFAARQGCLDCVKALAAKGAQIDYADPEGVTALIVAVNNFNFDIGAWLLSQGANPNLWDWWGRTALWCAVDLNTVPRGGRPDMPSMDRTSSLQMIQLLLKAGANPNLQLKLLPPYRAVGADRGADPLLTIGSTPLLRAAKAGDAEATRLLLAAGANPNLPQMAGITPVMAAAGLGSTNIDTRGSLKTQAGMIDSLKLMLAAGGDLALQDKQGRTALHGAAFWGYNDVVKFLAANHAPLQAKDAKGLTPMDHALGKAGGQGRGGQGVTVYKDTAALLEQLQAAAVTAQR